MEKIVFKNSILNIVVGGLLILLAILGFVLQWFEDFLPIFIAVVIVLLSIKRFAYTFKKITSKNATLILVIELALDFVFAGLLIYFQDYIELFVGLTIYSRGVSYLLINYIATRKIKIKQYLLNILYLTFGSFLMFYPLNSGEVIVIAVTIIFLLIGIIFLQSGISSLVQNKKKEKRKLQSNPIEKDSNLEKNTQPSVAKVSPEKPVSKKPEIDYQSMTVAELKAMAKEKNLQGYSQLNKAELIEKLKK